MYLSYLPSSELPFAYPAPALSPPLPFDESQANVCPPCCWCCMRDVSWLPVTARFCPRCGSAFNGIPRRLPIPAAAVGAVLTPGVQIEAYTEEGRRRIAAWLGLRNALSQTAAPVQGALPSRTGARTQIVIGYANAMYHLGTRYEDGLAIKRMPGEAARCFLKSARLGNADAKMRLS